MDFIHPLFIYIYMNTTDIIVILLVFAMVHYWLNYWNQCVENYSDQISTTLQNVAKIYQTGDIVLDNLTITGNLNINEDASIDNNLNVTNRITTKSLQVNNDTTLISPGDNTLLLRSTGGNPKVQFFKNSTQQGWIGISNDGNLWLQSNAPQGAVLIAPKLYKTFDNFKLTDGNDITSHTNFVAANADQCVSSCLSDSKARSSLYRKSDNVCFCKSSININDNPDSGYISTVFA